MKLVRLCLPRSTHLPCHPGSALTEYMAFSSSRALACLMASASSLSFRSILRRGRRATRRDKVRLQAESLQEAKDPKPSWGVSHSFSAITEYLLHARRYLRHQGLLKTKLPILMD